MNAPSPGSLPLVMFDTNILFDFFLGRDPDIGLLSGLSKRRVAFKVPELVMLEFRGAILRELGAKEQALSPTRALAKELERADHWMSGVDSLRAGCEAVIADIARLRARLDPFIAKVRDLFEIIPHNQDIHYRGDLRFVQGLPPDRPKRGVQDCRIFEAVLEIARDDQAIVRPGRFFLTKDADFLNQAGVRGELALLGVDLVEAAAPLYWRFVQATLSASSAALGSAEGVESDRARRFYFFLLRFFAGSLGVNR